MNAGQAAGGNGKLIGIGIAVVAAGVLGLSLTSSIFDENQAGFMKVKQAFPSGTLSVISDPGYFGQWFGTLTEYKQAGTYSFSSDHAESGGDTEGATLIGNSIPVRFADGGQARISGSARFTVPIDEQSLLNIHTKFRSYQSLATGLLKPAIREAIVLSAALMTAEESYSGGKAQLSQYALDQLQNGVYLTESEEVDVLDRATGKKTGKTERIVKIRMLEDGITPIRKENSLDAYQIEVTQLFFPDDFAYEDGIKNQIAKVRDAQMKATTAFAEAEAAAQDELTAVAKGRADVAKAKANAEVQKQKEVTLGEQKRDVALLAAETRRRAAVEDALAAAEEKKANILRGEGEAKRKSLVFTADGALQQKLDAYVETQRVWAAAFKDRKVPGSVISTGSSGSGAGTDGDVAGFMALMTAQAARDLSLDLRNK